MINKVQLLEQYRDKAYVSNVLCQLTSEYYNRVKNILTLPLIISSTIMMVLNASNVHQNEMKYINIILNASTSLILAMSNNFKIPEKHSLFRSTALKFNKLTHFIEDKLMYDKEEITQDAVRDIISQYDTLYENLEYPFPSRVKNAVKKTYKNKRTMPNILNCETVFTNSIDVDNTSSSIVYKSPKVLNTKIIKVNGLQSIEEEEV